MPRKQLSMTKYRTCHWISLLFHPRQSDFEGLLLRTSLISGCHRYNFRLLELRNDITAVLQQYSMRDGDVYDTWFSQGVWNIVKTMTDHFNSSASKWGYWYGGLDDWVFHYNNTDPLHYEWFITTRRCISYNVNKNVFIVYLVSLQA